MQIHLRPAILPAELRSLILFDRKTFHQYPGDWFDAEAWQHYACWWLLLGGRKIGCCAFERHVDFQQDLRRDAANPPCRGSLYIASTGILPAFRNQGFGALLKSWQISYARHHRFHRIITNTRKSNHAMIRLNQKFGFKILRTTPHYYYNPAEPTVVMELSLLRRHART